MKLAMKALVPTLALVAALSLPSVAEASHRHGPRCGHRGYDSDGYRSDGYSRGSGYGYSDGYYSDGYSRGSRHGYYSRPYGYSSRYRGYHPRYYGHGYARVPYGYGYGYDDGYGYGYYPPPPPYRSYRGRRPRVGVSLYFGF